MTQCHMAGDATESSRSAFQHAAGQTERPRQLWRHIGSASVSLSKIMSSLVVIIPSAIIHTFKDYRYYCFIACINLIQKLYIRAVIGHLCMLFDLNYWTPEFYNHNVFSCVTSYDYMMAMDRR